MAQYNIEIVFTNKEAEDAAKRLKTAFAQLDSEISKVSSQLKNISSSGTALDALSSKTKKASDAMDRHKKSVDRAAKSYISLGAVAKTFFSYIGIKQLAKYSDSYTQMGNKIRALGGETTDYIYIQQQLFNVAQRSRTSLDGTVQLYSRLMLAQKNLGASQQDLIRFTEGIGKAMQISGTSAFTQRGVLLQLSQAIGTDVVRAEEFNSILEGGIRIAQAAADGIAGYEGNIAKLRKAVIDGKISSKEFFEAILSQIPKLEAEFAKTTPTIQQAFTILDNAMIKFIGEINESFGITEKFSKAIIFLSENLKELAIAFSIGFGTLALSRLSAFIAGFTSLSQGMKFLSVNTKLLIRNFTQFHRLMGLISKHPFVFTITAAATAFAFLSKNVDEADRKHREEIESIESINRLLEKGHIWRVDDAKAAMAQVEASRERTKALLDETAAAIRMQQISFEANRPKHPLAKAIYDAFGSKDIEDNEKKLQGYIDEYDKLGETLEKLKKELANAEKMEASQKKEQQRTALDDFIDSLKFEEEQLKRTNIQQAIYNDLKKAKLDVNAIKISETGDYLGGAGELEDRVKQIIEIRKSIEELSKKKPTKYEGPLSGLAKEIGDVRTQLESLTVNILNKTEDAFIDFAKEGKSAFKDLANSILEDIARVVYRMTIMRATMAMFGFSDTMSTANTGNGSGSIFDSISSWFGGKADGGKILGIGTGTSDSIPTMLSNGEYVVNARSTKKFEPLLEAINNSPRFADGGKVGGGIGSAMGSFGNNVNIEVIDQRGTDAPPIQTKTSQGPDGSKMITMLIKQTVQKGFADGSFDSSIRNSYGIRRSATTRG